MKIECVTVLSGVEFGSFTMVILQQKLNCLYCQWNDTLPGKELCCHGLVSAGCVLVSPGREFSSLAGNVGFCHIVKGISVRRKCANCVKGHKVREDVTSLIMSE